MADSLFSSPDGPISFSLSLSILASLRACAVSLLPRPPEHARATVLSRSFSLSHAHSCSPSSPSFCDYLLAAAHNKSLLTFCPSRDVTRSPCTFLSLSVDVLSAPYTPLANTGAIDKSIHLESCHVCSSACLVHTCGRRHHSCGIEAPRYSRTNCCGRETINMCILLKNLDESDHDQQLHHTYCF